MGIQSTQPNKPQRLEDFEFKGMPYRQVSTILRALKDNDRAVLTFLDRETGNYKTGVIDGSFVRIYGNQLQIDFQGDRARKFFQMALDEGLNLPELKLAQENLFGVDLLAEVLPIHIDIFPKHNPILKLYRIKKKD